MKNVFFVTVLSLFTAVSGFSQKSSDEKMVSKIVHQFAASADKQDAVKMEKILDTQYRAVLNQLFGSKEVSVMDKTAYLQMIRDKKIGGDNRKVEILAIDITHNNAAVKARFTGTELNFQTYLFLAKDTHGQWKIVSDMPFIEKV